MLNMKSWCSSGLERRECTKYETLLDRERTMLRDGTGTHCVKAINDVCNTHSDQMFEKRCAPRNNAVFWDVLFNSYSK